MRVCPVCDEAFGDEFNFCDLDGTALKRKREPGERETSRAWSLIGVGLLLGALVISAASIVFLPRAQLSPAANSTRPSANGESQAAGAAGSLPVVIVEEGNSPNPNPPPAVPKETAAMSESEAKAMASDTRDAADPKASLGSEGAEMKEAPKASAEASKEKPGEKTVEPPTLRTVAESAPKERKTEPSVKDPKDAARPDAATKGAKSSPKDDDKENDKKKGGFLKIFKKIFGKKQ